MGNKLPFSNHNHNESPFDEDSNENSLLSCKVLLLGTGDSGKSTLYVQYLLLREPDKLLFDPYIPAIHQNVYDIIKEVVEHCIKKNPEKPLDEEKNILTFKEIYSKKRDSMIVKQQSILLSEDFEKIIRISKDKKVEETLNGETRFGNQKHRYFLAKDNIRRILTMGYRPTKQDIIYARKKTLGITQTSFMSNGIKMTMVDVGGQKTERKKWIKCFSGIQILIYLISLSDFDEGLYEDSTINSMQDSLETFKLTINGEHFAKTPILVLFNKIDLLEKKISEKDTLKNVFPEYKGENDPKKAEEFIVNMFISTNKGDPNRLRWIVCRMTEKFSIEQIDKELVSIMKMLKETNKLTKL